MSTKLIVPMCLPLCRRMLLQLPQFANPTLINVSSAINVKLYWQVLPPCRCVDYGANHKAAPDKVSDAQRSLQHEVSIGLTPEQEFPTRNHQHQGGVGGTSFGCALFARL